VIEKERLKGKRISREIWSERQTMIVRRSEGV
jgi:hypothetical protein